ncbi:hypothetical protein STRDD10_01497 [Streptococcus sp. DD10]|nr:hypothetical protein STRDD10_01497 [Streptococcus sp. DD10]
MRECALQNGDNLIGVVILHDKAHLTLFKTELVPGHDGW